MSAVNITNVTVLDNPAAFLNPFQFEISYECLTPLKDGAFLGYPSVLPLDSPGSRGALSSVSVELALVILVLCLISW